MIKYEILSEAVFWMKFLSATIILLPEALVVGHPSLRDASIKAYPRANVNPIMILNPAAILKKRRIVFESKCKI